MTSIERCGESTYGKDESPAYNALSYTWGRWEIPRTDDVQPLKIDGVVWDIPAINPNHFTVAAFRRVIERASEGCDYIWVDIACIDQENERVKAQEIGNQAAIFNRADYVFVWLSHTSEESMTNMANALWDPDNGPFTGHLVLERIMLLPDCEDIMKTWHKRISQLLGDPWFSSLWTFQEAYLRRDAQLLHQDAEVVKTPYANNLFRIFDSCSVFHTDLSNIISERVGGLHPDVATVARKLLHLIEESGCDALVRDNPVALYAASSYRRAAQPEDHVYGIMQIYGLVLGKSADPKANYTREQLGRQLGQALIQRSPVMAQLFVHMGPSEPYRSWCVSKNSIVPAWVHGFLYPMSHCEIIFAESEEAYCKGKMCNYANLISFWDILNKHPSRKLASTVQKTYVDATARNLSTIPEQLRSIHLKRDIHQDELAQALQAEYGQGLSVLLTGTVTAAVAGRPKRLWMGVLVYQEEDSRSGWPRVGFCLWEDAPGDVQSTIDALFSPCEVLLA